MIMQPGLHDSKTMPQAFPTLLDPPPFLQWLGGMGVCSEWYLSGTADWNNGVTR